MRYILPGIQLVSEYPLDSFCAFIAAEHSDLPLSVLTVRYEPYSPSEILFSVEHNEIHIASLADGWLYHLAGTEDYALHVSRDYRQLTAYVTDATLRQDKLLPLVRTALECASVSQGVLSLHSSCVELDGQAVCFTAPSGTGKSTRARSWNSGLGAKIISGDRPSVCLKKDGVFVSGAPWDGKEQIYVNVSVPLRAICWIRRGSKTYVRHLSPNRARECLLRQCFIPMWDTDVAAMVMMLILRLCSSVPVYRVTCGPDEAAAKEVRDLVFHRFDMILEVQQDMKIKSGFTLRNMLGEHIVMPIGRNISQFDGAIVLNDVAAFIWEKLSEGCSREELLEDILSEFEVDRERAETDLDALLEKFRGYGVIEEESV